MKITNFNQNILPSFSTSNIFKTIINNKIFIHSMSFALKKLRLFLADSLFLKKDIIL